MYSSIETMFLLTAFVMAMVYSVHGFVRDRRKHREQMASLERTGEMLEMLKDRYEAEHGSIWESRDQWRAHVTKFIDHLDARVTNEKTRIGQ